MSVLNNASEDEAPECPLCLEYLELDDINFYPCSCEYQICRFCWNKIRMEGSGLCPACRSPYAENPADFKPLTAEELAKIKAEKRQKDAAKKAKISENRKHLANVRVVQRNLVFVVGLSPRLADQEVLRKTEYFGKFGKIHKVVINHSTSYAGSQSQQQGPSASAYVTYYKPDDALRAIQAVNNIFIDSRTLKASLGTTKYCSHFMKNQSCPKHDCMYLHELGDEAASFTKEEMQQGKHTDYERALHDEMLSQTNGDGGGGSKDSQQHASSAGVGETPTTTTSLAPSASSSSLAASGRSGGTSTAASVVAGSTNGGGEEAGGSSQEEQEAPPPPPPATTSQRSNRNKNHEEKRKNNNNNNHSEEQQQQQQHQKQSRKEREKSSSKEKKQQKESWPNLAPSKSTESFTDRNGDTDPSENGRNYQPSPVYQQSRNEDQLGTDFSHNNPASSTSPRDSPLQEQQQQQQLIPQKPREPSLFDDDEDLGFDPFAETQKGLAEMLETETQMVQQHQQQQAQREQQQQQHSLHQHHRQNHHSGHGSVSPGIQAGDSNGLPFGLQQQLLGGGGVSSAPQRLKAPPPGFSNSLSNNVPTSNFSRFSGNNFDQFSALQPQHHPQQPHLNSGGGGSFAGIDFGFSNHNLEPKRSNGMNPNWQQQQHPQQQQPHHGGGGNKDWQDGFRALLPNINVNFGALPSNGGSANNGGGSRLPAFVRGGGAESPLQQNESRGWNGGLGGGGSDLTMLDPAIVGGMVSNHPPPQLSHHGQRPESPSSWIKTNLEQLTSATDNSHHHHNAFKGHSGPPPMLSGFSGLSLNSGSSNGLTSSSRHLAGGWGAAAPTSGGGAAPPPGFGLNPAAMAALQQSSGQQQLPPFGGNSGDGQNGAGKSDFFTLA